MAEIDKTIQALEKNNIKSFFVKNKDQARELVLSIINKDDIVGTGGSLTLDQCGIRDELRKEYNFLDWFKQNISEDERQEILRKTLTCDTFLTGSNAVTEDGKLFNVDGRGNRVSAMTFGPKKVIIVVGKNKIVKNLEEARQRVRNIAAPLNTKRLGKKTPCVKTGKCMDCSSPDRICRQTLIQEQQKPGRMNLIIVDEDLGY